MIKTFSSGCLGPAIKPADTLRAQSITLLSSHWEQGARQLFVKTPSNLPSLLSNRGTAGGSLFIKDLPLKTPSRGSGELETTCNEHRSLCARVSFLEQPNFWRVQFVANLQDYNSLSKPKTFYQKVDLISIPRTESTVRWEHKDKHQIQHTLLFQTCSI